MTWMRGDWPYRQARRPGPSAGGGLFPSLSGSEVRGGRASYWCSPYCPSTFPTIDERSVHRADCAGFARYVEFMPVLDE